MANYILYFLVALNVAFLAWLVYLTQNYSKILKKAGILFAEESPKELPELLKRYLKEVKEVEDHCFVLDKEIKKVETMAATGLHKTGFVRYNPFGDVGGNQSFALALLDSKGSGYVISSVHSRTGTRVYSKSVSSGESQFNLSDEEKKAIAIALK